MRAWRSERRPRRRRLWRSGWEGRVTEASRMAARAEMAEDRRGWPEWSRGGKRQRLGMAAADRMSGWEGQVEEVPMMADGPGRACRGVGRISLACTSVP